MKLVIYTLFLSILFCSKRDKNTEFNHKNATKRAFFMVKWRHIFKEETKSAEASLENAGFCVVLSDFAENWPVNPINSKLYYYGGNNPIKYVNLDGRVWDTVWGICVTLYDFGKAIYQSC